MCFGFFELDVLFFMTAIRDRLIVRILLLACALLLALPVGAVFASQHAGVLPDAGRLAMDTVQDASMTTNVGLIDTGFAGNAWTTYKPYGAAACSGSTAHHPTVKAIAGQWQGISSLAFGHTLQTTHVSIQNGMFCAPPSCRAPPFSSLL